jgi:hypothetical protein
MIQGRKHKVTTALVSLFMAVGAGAASLESDSLKVSIGDRGELSVLDKRSGRTWRQVALGERAPLANTPRLKGRLFNCPLHVVYALDFDGLPRAGGQRQPVPFEVSVRLEKGDELVAEFTPTASAVTGEWSEVRYPFAFLPPEGEQPNLLYPHGEGMLVPASRKHPGFLELQTGELYGGTRSYLNCVGTVELLSGAGLLTIPMPFEAADVYWPGLQGGLPGAVGIQHGWRANRYKLDRPYSLRWQFTATGGYVAMAKGYRRWCGVQGWRKTLREKADENPDVEKLIGAPVLWGFGSVSELDQLVDGLCKAGVDRCVLGLDQRLYDCMIEPSPAEQAERRALVEKARRAGFLVHHYDNYRDTFERNPKLLAWNQVNWDAYPQDVMVRENGQLLSPGFPAGNCGVITPGAFMKYAKKNLPRDLKRYPWNARFIDCVGSVSFDLEGVDWHPERRQTSFYYTRQKREELMKYSNQLGQVTGTECGMDYLIPFVHWFDGAMHLVSFMDMPPGTFGLQGVAETDGSIKGSIKGQAVGKHNDLDGQGKPFPISESVCYRIPFWSLVHHDDAVVTWRWEHGMHKPMLFWTRKLLLNMLHGTPPMYGHGMSAAEFPVYKEAIAYTHRLTSHWGRRVGFDEMVSHRFVTADRLVQETRFSSGVGICVNFGRTPFKVQANVEIPGEGYVVFTRKAGDDAESKFESPVAVRVGEEK